MFRIGSETNRLISSFIKYEDKKVVNQKVSNIIFGCQLVCLVVFEILKYHTGFIMGSICIFVLMIKYRPDLTEKVDIESAKGSQMYTSLSVKLLLMSFLNHGWVNIIVYFNFYVIDELVTRYRKYLINKRSAELLEKIQQQKLPLIDILAILQAKVSIYEIIVKQLETVIYTSASTFFCVILAFNVTGIFNEFTVLICAAIRALPLIKRIKFVDGEADLLFLLAMAEQVGVVKAIFIIEIFKSCTQFTVIRLANNVVVNCTKLIILLKKDNNITIL